MSGGGATLGQMAESSAPDSVEARLTAEIETLRQLLELNEATAVMQAQLAEKARLEAVRIADAREEQRKLIHDIIAAGADAVIVLDCDFRITYMNRQAIESAGDGRDLVGGRLMDVFPELESSPFWPRFQRVMCDRKPMSFEDFYAPHKQWYQVNVSPVGHGIALFYRDITERRRRDELMQRTEKLAAVGRLASSISHEINNPLESVTNLLYLIEQSPSIDAQSRSYTLLASSELARVSHIVTQTLKFHRQSTHAVSTRASELIEGVLLLFQARINTAGTEVHKRYDEDDAMLCFSGDMRQVLANLIGNALDAIGHGGELWLRTRRTHQASTGKSGVRITIADTGGGMSAGTQRSLFEAFFTTKASLGTGLGLWVSREIVRTHHGSIALRSRQSPQPSGTVFAIFIPD
jgi:PAS domain S-box-containing protein